MKSLATLVFANILQRYIQKGIHSLTPVWLLRFRLYRKFIAWIFPGAERSNAVTYGEIHPYIIRMIKEHQDTLDEANIRDFLGRMRFLFLKIRSMF